MAEAGRRCPICSREILPNEPIADRHGQASHLACLDARKPGAKAAPASFKNVRDERGDPICPVCGRTVSRTESMGRVDEYLVHIECVPRARQLRP
jgi:endogenous inhibitor of DNA gyrase (YacG/DUF329 family)